MSLWLTILGQSVDVKIYWLLSTILDEAITELKSNSIKGTLAEFLDWPIETLDELLVIKDGKISRLIIN